MGGVESVETLQTYVADAEYVAYRCLFGDDLFGFAAEHLAGLGVDVHDLAFLVEIHDAHDRGVEYRPVAQRPIVFIAFVLALLCHVLLGADNHPGLAFLVAAQHREHDIVVAQVGIAAFHVFRPQAQCQFFLFIVLRAFRQSVQGRLQSRGVLGAVALREFLHRVGVGHLPVVVAPCKLVLHDVVGPYSHLAGLQDQGQSSVAHQVLPVELVALYAVADGVGTCKDDQQEGYSQCVPDPLRGLGFQSLGVEPLVLQWGDLVGGIEFGVGFV